MLPSQMNDERKLVAQPVGVLCSRKIIHDGRGRPCADGLARLWPLPLVTEAKPLPSFMEEHSRGIQALPYVRCFLVSL